MKLLVTAATLAVLFYIPALAQGQIKASPGPVTGGATANAAPPERKAEPDAAILHFRTCRDARAAGYSRMRTGQPGYARHLDRDNDGIACE
ncbi:hypothetical protein CQ14_06755 [Bradyrhizobium lablabi]|uniref:Excalibur calcium-binding domain-containing protein n=1 Tax=Bradyrhizobium lablabi TaxID=722472 RepID=A0A0R3MT42_9BRAD|nr:excalibur calcium-binding domain-containing protein [Bradyrhizobium lablabi]KRR21343.1 hypothetical protein CQ14_06755 [Bradyrhizobium lablabi]